MQYDKEVGSIEYQLAFVQNVFVVVVVNSSLTFFGKKCDFFYHLAFFFRVPCWPKRPDVNGKIAV